MYKYTINIEKKILALNSYIWKDLTVFKQIIYAKLFQHHHQVVPPARISLTLSRHFSLLFIAFGRSSGFRDRYLIMLSVEQGGIKYYFWVFCMTWPEIEPRSPGSLSNTQPIRLMIWLNDIIIIIIMSRCQHGSPWPSLPPPISIGHRSR